MTLKSKKIISVTVFIICSNNAAISYRICQIPQGQNYAKLFKNDFNLTGYSERGSERETEKRTYAKNYMCKN